MLLRHEKPFPWGLKRTSELASWQIELIYFAEFEEHRREDARVKTIADYIGSYTDPKRAREEMKSSIESGSDGSESSSTQVIYKNENFGKEPEPVVRMETKEDGDKFLSEFDKAMREKFGDDYEAVKVVTPSTLEKKESGEDDEPDIITAG